MYVSHNYQPLPLFYQMPWNRLKLFVKVVRLGRPETSVSANSIRRTWILPESQS